MAAETFVPIRVQLGLGNAAAQFDKLRSGFANLEKQTDKLQSFGNKLSLSISAPLTAFAGLAVKSATQMDSLTRGLTAVAGSSEKAQQQLKSLKEVAKLPGLGLKEAIQGSISLQAAGLSAELAERSLKAFGNALATVGKGKADLDGVTLALSQIESKGKVSAEEINQIAERVPQIRKAMVAAFGTADTELLAKSKLTSRQFIEGVTKELEKLPQVAGGAQNTFENLSDTAQQALTRIGVPILKAVIPSLDKLIPKVEEAGKAFESLDSSTQTAVLGFGLFAIAGGPLIKTLGAVAGAATSVTSAISGAGGLLAAVSSINPYTLAAGLAIAGLAATWYTASKQMDESAERIRLAVIKANGGKGNITNLADGKQAFTLSEKDLNGKEVYQSTIDLSDMYKGKYSGIKTVKPLTDPTVKTEAEKLRDLLAGPKVKAGGSRGSGAGKAIKLTEAQELQQQLSALNKEIGILGNVSSPEYKLKVQIENAQTVRSELEELLKLRIELGRPDVNLSEGRALADYNKAIKTKPEIVFTTPEFIKKDLEARTKAAEKEADIADLIAETAQTLRERLEDLNAGGDGRSNEISIRRQLRKAGASGDDADSVIAQAAELDKTEKAQRDYSDALEEGRRRMDSLRSTLTGLFDSLLEGPKSFLQSLKSLGKKFLSDGLANLLTSGGQGGAASGGKGGFGQLLNTFLGGGGQGGGGGLSNLFRTPGFNPAATTPGVSAGASGGGFLGKIGGFLGLGGGAGAALAPGAVGAATSLGAGAAAGGGLAASLAGLGAAAGGTAAAVGAATTAASGAVAAAGGAAAGGAAGIGSLLGGLAPLLTNPITAIAVGAAIGGYFLYKHFSNRDLKSLRKLINQRYGVDVKDNSVLKQIRDIGKQRFGKDYKNRLSDVVALPEVKEIVSNYAESNGLESDKLQSKATLSNPYSAPNYFTRGGSEFQPSIRPASDASGGGGAFGTASGGGGLASVVAELAGVVRGLTTMTPGALVKEGLPSNNDLIAEGVRREQRRDQQFGTGFLADNGF